jgi:esterase/lipase
MRKKWLLVMPVILLLVYYSGPKPATPVYENDIPYVPAQSDSLERYIGEMESQHKLKPDNYARIIWADEKKKERTEYAIIYLHGFSASQAEGEPAHRDIAKVFGCNLYLSRLAEHGIDTMDALANFNIDEYWHSARQAFAIGKKLGKKVILMGTSTGGTLALMLAARYADVYALILLSPNIEINDPNSWLLNNPWGLQIARKVLSSNYIESRDQRPVYKQYWYSKYRIEGAVQLEELLETAMKPSTFNKVYQPVLSLYYYKDQVHQDSVVRVDAIKRMMNEIGTPHNLKVYKSMPNTGNHVLASYIKSKDISGVENEIEKFMTEVLHMKRL